MGGAPIWITEADVTATISLPDAIGALERILAMEAGGGAANLPKTHLMVADNDAMHAIGASIAGAGICGTKTWVNVGGKSQTVLILFSLEDGRLRAVVEATALGQMRTAAMTGVGTGRLAPKDARCLALIGTGKQALPNAAACAAVRDNRGDPGLQPPSGCARRAGGADRGRARDPSRTGRERRGCGRGCADRHRDHQRDRTVSLRRDDRARRPSQRDGGHRAGPRRVYPGRVRALRRHRRRHGGRRARAFRRVPRALRRRRCRLGHRAPPSPVSSRRTCAAPPAATSLCSRRSAWACRILPSASRSWPARKPRGWGRPCPKGSACRRAFGDGSYGPGRALRKRSCAAP